MVNVKCRQSTGIKKSQQQPAMHLSQQSASQAAVQASKCSPAALMEDDIDWRSSSLTDKQPAYDASGAQQLWTVQFLEAPGNAEDLDHAVNLDNSTNFGICETALTKKISGKCNTRLSESVKSLHNQDPVKHGTKTLIEDDIQWD